MSLLCITLEIRELEEQAPEELVAQPREVFVRANSVQAQGKPRCIPPDCESFSFNHRG